MLTRVGVRPRPSAARLLPALAAAALAGAGPAAAGEAPARAPAPAAARGPAKPPVALDDFIAALAPMGKWAEHPRWGQTWRPDGVREGWQPYTAGRWAPSEEGWYWVSDEPWGWATYHFGRWFIDPFSGWRWVPGRQWAPAWVAWREGKRLVGWAPLGPDGHTLAPTFVFVPRARMEEPAQAVALPALQVGQGLKETAPIGAPTRRDHPVRRAKRPAAPRPGPADPPAQR